MGITKEKADELYKHYSDIDESQEFMNALIEMGADYVTLKWNMGEITVTVMIESEFVDYKFDPYDNY